jgi:hypothetical protein
VTGMPNISARAMIGSRCWSKACARAKRKAGLALMTLSASRRSARQRLPRARLPMHGAWFRREGPRPIVWNVRSCLPPPCHRAWMRLALLALPGCWVLQRTRRFVGTEYRADQYRAAGTGSRPATPAGLVPQEAPAIPAEIVGRCVGVRDRIVWPWNDPFVKFASQMGIVGRSRRSQCLPFGHLAYMGSSLVIQASSAGVAELVDALDLGSSIVRCGGSNPFARTSSPSPCGWSSQDRRKAF